MDTIFTASQCHINLGAIRRNFRRLGAQDALMPVIKSDAYGHGLMEVARALADAGACRFAVGMAAEGVALREAGIKGQIMPLLGCLSPEDWQLAVTNELLPLAGSFDDIEKARICAASGPRKKLPVAIKCDTGMGRLGFSPQDAPAAREALLNAPELEPVMLVSHLACADMPEEQAYTDFQTRLFDEFYETLKSAFPNIMRSLANSAGALSNPGGDVMRPGLALYGYNPLPGEDNSGLEPAMSVSTPVIHIRHLEPGQSLSYGRIFTAQAPTRVAITVCGYATGFPRIVSGRAQMLLNGKRVNQIGRVCMSMAMLDITDQPEVKIGDRAWILGGEAASGEKPVDAKELADLAGAIPYELLCVMGSMNPRVYS